MANLKTRLACGEQIQVRNSSITNYGVRKHAEGHENLPYELIWAYGRGRDRGVCWAFFPTLSAAAQAAEDLTNNVRERTTGAIR